MLNKLLTTSALDRALGKDREAGPNQTNSAEWVLDADLVDTCALAAFLVQRTRATGGRRGSGRFRHRAIAEPRRAEGIFETYLQLAVARHR